MESSESGDSAKTTHPWLSNTHYVSDSAGGCVDTHLTLHLIFFSISSTLMIRIVMFYYRNIIKFNNVQNPPLSLEQVESLKKKNANFICPLDSTRACALLLSFPTYLGPNPDTRCHNWVPTSASRNLMGTSDICALTVWRVCALLCDILKFLSLFSVLGIDKYSTTVFNPQLVWCFPCGHVVCIMCVAVLGATLTIYVKKHLFFPLGSAWFRCPGLLWPGWSHFCRVPFWDMGNSSL